MSAGVNPVRLHSLGRHRPRVHGGLVVPLRPSWCRSGSWPSPAATPAAAPRRGPGPRRRRAPRPRRRPRTRSRSTRNGSLTHRPARYCVHRERLPRDRVRVGGGVGALGDRDLAEVLTGRPVDGLVPAGPHRDPLRREHEAVRSRELPLPRHGDRTGDGAEAMPRPAVQRPVHQHRPTQAGVDHRGRGGDAVGDRVATGVERVRPRELVAAHRPRHLDGARRVTGLVRVHPVEHIEAEPRVGQRRATGFHRHGQRRPSALTRVLGAADPDDGTGHRSTPVMSAIRVRSRPRRPPRRRATARRAAR